MPVTGSGGCFSPPDEDVVPKMIDRSPGSDPLLAAREAYLEAADAIARACLQREQEPQSRLTNLLQEALSAGRAASLAVRFSLTEEGDAIRQMRDSDAA